MAEEPGRSGWRNPALVAGLVAGGLGALASGIAVLDYLLWRARPHGADRCQVSYRAMADNLHLRRATLVDAVCDLAAAGLLTKLRT